MKEKFPSRRAFDGDPTVLEGIARQLTGWGLSLGIQEELGFRRNWEPSSQHSRAQGCLELGWAPRSEGSSRCLNQGL